MPDVSAAVPPSLLMVAERVEARLDALLSAEVARWRALSPDLEPPLDSLRSLVMNGGKRLRPAFCFWAYCGAGGDPESPEVIDAGAAFRSEERRVGKECVRKCRSRWSPSASKKKTIKHT